MYSGPCKNSTRFSVWQCGFWFVWQSNIKLGFSVWVFWRPSVWKKSTSPIWHALLLFRNGQMFFHWTEECIQFPKTSCGLSSKIIYRAFLTLVNSISFDSYSKFVFFAFSTTNADFNVINGALELLNRILVSYGWLLGTVLDFSEITKLCSSIFCAFYQTQKTSNKAICMSCLAYLSKHHSSIVQNYLKGKLPKTGFASFNYRSLLFVDCFSLLIIFVYYWSLLFVINYFWRFFDCQ